MTDKPSVSGNFSSLKNDNVQRKVFFFTVFQFLFFSLICKRGPIREIVLVEGQTFYAFSFHVRLLRNIKFWILWRSHIVGKHR